MHVRCSKPQRHADILSRSYLDIVSLAAQLLRHFSGGLRAERKPSQTAARLSKEDGLHAQKEVRYVNLLGLYTKTLGVTLQSIQIISGSYLPLEACCGWNVAD